MQRGFDAGFDAGTVVAAISSVAGGLKRLSSPRRRRGTPIVRFVCVFMGLSAAVARKEPSKMPLPYRRIRGLMRCLVKPPAATLPAPTRSWTVAGDRALNAAVTRPSPRLAPTCARTVVVLAGQNSMIGRMAVWSPQRLRRGRWTRRANAAAYGSAISCDRPDRGANGRRASSSRRRATGKALACCDAVGREPRRPRPSFERREILTYALGDRIIDRIRHFMTW